MASLRDVFNHAGKRVRLERADGTQVEGLGVLRDPIALVEAKLAPRPDEFLVFLERGQRFRIAESVPETHLGRVDHYRLRIVPS